MNVTYSNCYLGDVSQGDWLITDEIGVVRSLPPSANTLVPDARIDPAAAELLNVTVWRLAYEWFKDGAADPTVVQGISAGDIAGAEVAYTVLLPAARGALEASAILEHVRPTAFTTVLAREGSGHYARVEGAQAAAVSAGLRTRLDGGLATTQVASGDSRNASLIEKYRLTRNPDWLDPGPRLARIGVGAALRALDMLGALRPQRGRPMLVVDEYNPTRAFALRYASQPGREYRLARGTVLRGEIASVVRSGDRILMPPRYPGSWAFEPAAEGLREFVADKHELISSRFTLAGVDLWPVLEPYLADVIERYSAFVSAAAPACREQLGRLRPTAVLVPGDTPPAMRVLVRVAQQMGIPTFVLIDGYKANDFEAECMTADNALAWSRALADQYLARRTQGHTTITGNPKADAQRAVRRPQPGGLNRILVGGFSFVPVDLNCRRSDPEWFLDQVLDGIGRSAATGARVIVKLHPADGVEHYEAVIASHPGLLIELVSQGDVVQEFASADAYITCASTSLLEAVASGIPVIYYRVNEQRLHPPFSDDELIERWTADDPGRLGVLLDRIRGQQGLLDDEERMTWCEHYLGPRDGQSVARIVEAIEREART